MLEVSRGLLSAATDGVSGITVEASPPPPGRRSAPACKSALDIGAGLGRRRARLSGLLPVLALLLGALSLPVAAQTPAMPTNLRKV